MVDIEKFVKKNFPKVQKLGLNIESSEKGEGTAEVSFKFNGEKYDYTAQVYYDWFDQKFISFLNEIFEKRGMAKRLIIFGDPNGAFFTYKTPEILRPSWVFSIIIFRSNSANAKSIVLMSFPVGVSSISPIFNTCTLIFLFN